MSQLEELLAGTDKDSFDLSPYQRVVPKPWGREIHWTPDDLPYMGKIICVNAGCRLSLQVHDQKTESWLLLEGRGGAIVEDDRGELVEIEFEPGQGYRSAIGQRHRLYAITDCRFLEVSTPELGTTYRLEDDYSRPDETEALRALPGRGYGAGTG